jgi:peptidoglycan-associated lipoprotein
MRKKLWISLALLFVIPGLLFTVSCAKKTVKEDTAVQEQQAEEDARIQAREAEQMERQRRMEEERLQEQEAARLRMMAAEERFLSEDIHFEFDSSNLLPEAQEILRWKAAWLQNNQNIQVTIEGHCDERGTNEYNLALGDRRANSAKSYLMDLGIYGSRVSTISYGEERPADYGSNEEAWAKKQTGAFHDRIGSISLMAYKRS